MYYNNSYHPVVVLNICNPQKSYGFNYLIWYVNTTYDQLTLLDFLYHHCHWVGLLSVTFVHPYVCTSQKLFASVKCYETDTHNALIT